MKFLNKKVTRVSVSKTGLKTESFINNTETIALVIPKCNIDEYKNAYVKRLSECGIKVEHEKDIFYKKPFWKFWGGSFPDLAIYKIIQ